MGATHTYHGAWELRTAAVAVSCCLDDVRHRGLVDSSSRENKQSVHVRTNHVVRVLVIYRSRYSSSLFFSRQLAASINLLPPVRHRQDKYRAASFPNKKTKTPTR